MPALRPPLKRRKACLESDGMGDDARGERQKRLAEALRANLKRRKAQKRERSAEAPAANRGERATTKESG